MKYGILLFSGILLISLGSNQQVFAGLFDPCSGVICNDSNPCTTDSCLAGSCLFLAGNAGATCRAAVGTCDVAETCLGFSSSCPSDSILPAFVTCRGATGVCDVAETCTGSSPFCPGDGFAPSTTSCGNPSETTCTFPDTCDGAGACSPNDVAAGASCDLDADECTDDACDGSGTCEAGPPITGTPACFPAVGGQIIPIQSTSLILAGAQTFSWMIPVTLSVLGIGLFVVSRKCD